jgi:hypothetical protein
LAVLAPLLEEERDSFALALVADLANPRDVHGSGAVAAFTTDNDPIDPIQV